MANMTTLPPAGFIDDLTDPAPAGSGVGGATQWFAQFQAWAAQQLGGQAEDAVSLAGDTFTPDQTLIALDTEGAATTDNLGTIGQTNVPDGQPILIRGTSTSRVITVKHGLGGTGQILLADAADFVLTDPSQYLWLVRRGTSWTEILRGYGNNKSAFRIFLGLVIGTNVQAYSAKLDAVAALTWAANKLPYFTSSSAIATADLTAFGRSLVAAADQAAAQLLLGIVAAPAISCRQCVAGGPVDANGLPNFLPATSVSLSLTTQNVTSTAPLVATAANGFGAGGNVDRVGISTANLTWSGLTASSTLYLYVDISAAGVMTPGFTTLKPTYQRGGSYSNTSGQFVFNTKEMIGKLGTGSGNGQAYRVFVGEITTGTTTVTATKAYALNGEYEAAWTNNLPGTGTNTPFNHNIGDDDVDVIAEFKALNAVGNYAAGDIVKNASVTIASGAAAAMPTTADRLTCSFTSGASAAFQFGNKTTGASFVPTASDFAYRMRAKRRWG